mmetsp:Transcript_10450/g.29055  ORF Transcript_10450/g.29055 Transcript_10450/m.29055 type:complete len:201 (-) Transcript_10450:159-761(-)
MPVTHGQVLRRSSCADFLWSARPCQRGSNGRLRGDAGSAAAGVGCPHGCSSHGALRSYGVQRMARCTRYGPAGLLLPRGGARPQRHAGGGHPGAHGNSGERHDPPRADGGERARSHAGGHARRRGPGTSAGDAARRAQAGGGGAAGGPPGGRAAQDASGEAGSGPGAFAPHHERCVHRIHGTRGKVQLGQPAAMPHGHLR